MDQLRNLIKRDDDDSEGMSSTTVNLLISLLVLVLFSLSLVGALLVIRRKRRASKQCDLEQGKKSGHHRSLTITTAPYSGKKESVYVLDEKRNLVENSSSPPSSPVPEIRITFPEEEDKSGKRTSGKVVVVRIGEKGGIGLEPCKEDLPPYQANSSDRFQSLDLERMGGLKEKDDKDDLKRYS